MKTSALPLNDAWMIETNLFRDERGQFARLFCQNELATIQPEISIKQINHSLTVQKGAVRGLHFQRQPMAEDKLIRCLRGSIFDIMVDLRKDSETFLHWHSEILSRENMKMLYIPKGFAHGFQTLEPNCELLYLHTEFYSSRDEGGLRYDDSRIGVQWPLPVTELSKRDKSHTLISDDFRGITL